LAASQETLWNAPCVPGWMMGGGMVIGGIIGIF
jgi:hypothetical protein